MNLESIEAVESSWAKVVPIAGQAADLFYKKLFELDPSLKKMFPADMAEQKKKLMQTIGVAVAGLRTPEKILKPVQDLGRRHVGYKVKPEHYDTVGQALLWTLQQGLGPAFTPKTREAWVQTYQLVSQIMKDAAAEAPVP